MKRGECLPSDSATAAAATDDDVDTDAPHLNCFYPCTLIKLRTYPITLLLPLELIYLPANPNRPPGRNTKTIASMELKLRIAKNIYFCTRKVLKRKK